MKQFSLPEQDLVWIEEVLELHSLYTPLPKTMNIMSISNISSYGMVYERLIIGKLQRTYLKKMIIVMFDR